MTAMPGSEAAPDCMCYMKPLPCICEPTERLLRLYAYSGRRDLAALTVEQRRWCLAEIDAIEGQPDDLETAADSDLARAVLTAWTDYARDKGLIA